jgi:hypothetical protein
MRKEIIATANIMKAPPSDATNGNTTLFILLHEPEEQRFGFPPKLAFKVTNNNVIYVTLSTPYIF